MAINYKKIGLLSAAVLLAQLAVSWLYNIMFAQQTNTLFAIQPTTGIGGSAIASKLVSYISGLIPFNITNILLIYAGAYILVLAGAFIYEQSFAWKGRNEGQRLFAILLYGHIALYVLLLISGLVAVPGASVILGIGLLVNLTLVSLLVTLSAKHLGFPRY